MNYVLKSACRGSEPRCLKTRQFHSRPHLIASLLRERNVARFIVAPKGFGKSSLALEYARVMFNLKSTIWLDCASPCFTRDLDAGKLADLLFEAEEKLKLVVFDDIPLLNSARIKKLSACFDVLIERHCEVIVTATPLCDTFATLQNDRIKLSAKDLLLTQDELLNYSRSINNAFATSSTALKKRAQCIPYVAWGTDKNETAVLQAIEKETLPTDVKAAFFGLLLAPTGNLETLQEFGFVTRPILELIHTYYPLVFIDGDYKRSFAPKVTINNLVDSFARQIDGIARLLHQKTETSVESKNEIVAAFFITCANYLIAIGEHERACQIMSFCSRGNNKMAWIEEKSFSFLHSVAIKPLAELYENTLPSCEPKTSLGRAYQALRCILLNQPGRARACIEETLCAKTYSKEAAYFIVALGYALQKQYTIEPLLNLQLGKLELSKTFDSHVFEKQLLKATNAEEQFICIFSFAFIYAQSSLSNSVDVWNDIDATLIALKANGRQAAIDARILASAFSVLKHQSVLRKWVLEDDSLQLLQNVATKMITYLQNADETQHYLHAIVLYAYNAIAAEKIVSPLENYLEMGKFQHLLQLVELQSMQTNTVSKRPSYAAELNAQVMKTMIENQVALRLPSSCSTNEDTQSKTPDDWDMHTSLGTKLAFAPTDQASKLYVRFFGSVELIKNNELVTSGFFRRKKVKVLLAILAADLGREISRDKLLSLIWPESSEYDARRSLYTLWGLLRKTLEGDENSCPYLSRTQGGYRLNSRYVNCDIQRIEELCRTFLVGVVNPSIWLELLQEFNDLYKGGFMPGETANEEILRLRRQYKTRCTDALVSAANRLMLEGVSDTAAWFARSAVRIDDSREDAYVALMEAQLQMGQRTAALDTYNDCRRALIEQLGIDPSVRAVKLYRRIIEEEAELALM